MADAEKKEELVGREEQKTVIASLMRERRGLGQDRNGHMLASRNKPIAAVSQLMRNSAGEHCAASIIQRRNVFQNCTERM